VVDAAPLGISCFTPSFKVADSTCPSRYIRYGDARLRQIPRYRGFFPAIVGELGDPEINAEIDTIRGPFLMCIKTAGHGRD
jgi:hypothetical protein